MNGLLARLGLVAVGLLAATIFGFRIHSWKADSDQLKAARQEIQSMRERYAVELKAAQEASYAYQTELDQIRQHPVASKRPVRLCRQSSNPKPFQPTTPAVDESPAPSGVVPETAGPDIGPDLYALARQCDEVSAELRALQTWVRQITTENR